MKTQVDEVVDGIYRLCTLPPGEYPVGFNQFLIDDECPTLVHTGFHDSYESVRKAVSEVLDPQRLRYVALLHFESDECGGMDRFVADSLGSTLVCSALSKGLNLDRWGYSGPVLGFQDGETLGLGRHRLRFLETPHVHHWDSMMVYEETTRSLFPADLFIQPGDQPPVVREDLTQEMLTLYRQVGIFAHEDPVRQVVDRIERLDPDWIHAMHGGSLAKEVATRFYRALREERFGYQGRLLGRELPSEALVGNASGSRP